MKLFLILLFGFFSCCISCDDNLLIGGENNPPEMTNGAVVPENGKAWDGCSSALLKILYWQKANDPDGDSLSYTLYFGIDALPSTPLELETTDYSGNLYPRINSGGETGMKCELGFAPLESGTYYWQVTVSDGRGGEDTSDEWNFICP